MNVALLLGADLVGLCLILAVAWEVQRRTGNSGWVDVMWTFGLGLAGAFVALWPIGLGMMPRQILVALGMAIWAVRLGTHVAVRTAKIDDDPRYAKLKAGWGVEAQAKMFGFLMIQAFAAFLLTIGPFVAARSPRPALDGLDILGAVIVLGSIVGEALSDWQIRAFSRDPANKGKVCDTGLWRYSRHPNYFFEWLGWVGYVVIAADFTGQYLWGWLALIGPAYMYYLLRYVSGVPPLERHMESTRPEAFAAYAARTNIFFLGPRKEPAQGSASGART